MKDYNFHWVSYYLFESKGRLNLLFYSPLWRPTLPLVYDCYKKGLLWSRLILNCKYFVKWQMINSIFNRNSAELVYNYQCVCHSPIFFCNVFVKRFFASILPHFSWVLGLLRMHAVWSYKEQMQILSTGCFLKFEVFWILVFHIL